MPTHGDPTTRRQDRSVVSAGSPGAFEETHWSIVLAAAKADGARRDAALEALCSSYWEPLYAYIRRLGHTDHDAEDLTQGFFAHLLSRRGFEGVGPEKGRFRSFLLASLKNFLANQRVRAAAVKRGGHEVFVPLDVVLAEGRFGQEAAAAPTAESHFDHRWAMTVMSRARARLEAEFAAAGKSDCFMELAGFLAHEGRREDYERVTTCLGMTPNAVAVAVHRLRMRFRDCIRAEIAETVASPRDLEIEMRYLLELLCAAG